MIDNPYRKIFKLDNDYIICNFSENIPAWKIEECSNFENTQLFLDCLSYAESRKFYNFYNVIFLSDYNKYVNKIKFLEERYNLTIEENIDSNEKSINIMFWDWLLDNLSHEGERLVMLHSLKQQYRK
jgi:hypothetical protein